MNTNHIREILKTIEEKWNKEAKQASNEAFGQGYAAAARGVLSDLKLLQSILDRDE